MGSNSPGRCGHPAQARHTRLVHEHERIARATFCLKCETRLRDFETHIEERRLVKLRGDWALWHGGDTERRYVEPRAGIPGTLRILGLNRRDTSKGWRVRASVTCTQGTAVRLCTGPVEARLAWSERPWRVTSTELFGEPDRRKRYMAGVWTPPPSAADGVDPVIYAPTPADYDALAAFFGPAPDAAFGLLRYIGPPDEAHTTGSKPR